jgi:futalosine hydrolase
MYLLIAATEKELSGLGQVEFSPRGAVKTLVCGVGPLESGVRCTRYLADHHKEFKIIVNFGIAGAYRGGAAKQVEMLDICLARREVLGDFGICCGEEIMPFTGADFRVAAEFEFGQELVNAAWRTLTAHGISCSVGTFVTVNGASGTATRGASISRRFEALCENMEGAAVARACQEFSLPLIEVRAVSNLVEDRPGTPWEVEEAAVRAARAAMLIINHVPENI